MSNLKLRNILIVLVISLCVLASLAGRSGLAAPPEPDGRAAPLLPAEQRQVSRYGFQPPEMDLSHLNQRLAPASVNGLPASFDWRYQNGKRHVGAIQNQGNLGTCYAFASVAQFESRLSIDGAINITPASPEHYFSENNAANCPMQKRSGACSGGWHEYVVNWFTQAGTVLAGDDPYSASCSACNTSPANGYQYTALEWLQLTGNGTPDVNTLKTYLMTYGPLFTTVKADNQGASGQTFRGYSLSSPPIDFWVSSSEAVDHAVVLIGWSDNPNEPSGGHWIARNSWGTGWGQYGFFEIAYGAANFGWYSSAVTQWQRYDPNGELLLRDLYGRTQMWGYNSTVGWGAVELTPTKNNCAARVEIWTNDSPTTADVYLYSGFDGQNFSGLLAQKTGAMFNTAGYHSIKLDSPAQLTAGSPVVAVVKFQDDSFGFPIPVDTKVGGSGKSYISSNGTSWKQLWDKEVGIRIRTAACASIPTPAPTNTPMPAPTDPPTPTSMPPQPSPTPDYPTETPTSGPTPTPLVGPTATPPVGPSPTPWWPTPTPPPVGNVCLSLAQVNTQQTMSPQKAAPVPAISQADPPLQISRPEVVKLEYELRQRGLIKPSVVLTAGDVITGLDPIPAQQPNVTGTVYSLDGATPAFGVLVNAFALADDGRRNYGTIAQGAMTDWNGMYGLTLAPGQYWLEIDPALIAGALMTGITVTVPTSDSIQVDPITLPPTPKHITGQVLRAGVPVSNAIVVGLNQATDRFAYGFVDPISQQFDMGVSGGDWDLYVAANGRADWVAYNPAALVSLANDSQSETVSVTLSVLPADGYLIGRVVRPDGSTPITASNELSDSVNYAASIDVWSPTGNVYSSGSLDTDGNFRIPLVAGSFQAQLWLSSEEYPFYAAPAPAQIEFGAGNLTLADTVVLQKNAVISGTVVNANNQPLAGVDVDMWQLGGAWTSTPTDDQGRYALLLPAGEWLVQPRPFIYSPYLYTGEPRQVTAGSGQAGVADFILESASNQVTGRVVDSQGKLLTGVEAWAYVRRADDPKPLAVTAVRSGQFEIKAPAGALRFGLYLAPGNTYSFVTETAPISLPQLAAAFDQAGATRLAALQDMVAFEQPLYLQAGGASPVVSVTLKLNDATLGGVLKNAGGQTVTGINGYVYAMPKGSQGAQQLAMVDPATGGYELSLLAGEWLLSYELQSDQYRASPPSPLAVTVAGGQNTQNITLDRLDGVVTGEVVDSANTPLGGVYVWVKGANYERFSLSDKQGKFKIYVPLSGGDSFRLGTAIQGCPANAPLNQCFQNAPQQTVTASPRGLDARAAEATAVVARLVVRGANAYMMGQVLDTSSNPVAGAYVSGYSDDWQYFEATTDNNGCYKAQVENSATSWIIDAFADLPSGDWFYDSVTINVSNQTLASTDLNGIAAPMVSAQYALELVYKERLPRGEAHSFLVDEGWSTTLTDGASARIPANVIQAKAGSELVASLNPTGHLPADKLYRPVGRGYEIELHDKATGRQMQGNLTSAVEITLRYDEDQLGVPASQLKPVCKVANSWQPEPNYTLDTQAHKITIRSNHVGKWALAVAQSSTPTKPSWYVYLPTMLKASAQ